MNTLERLVVRCLVIGLVLTMLIPEPANPDLTYTLDRVYLVAFLSFVLWAHLRFS